MEPEEHVSQGRSRVVLLSILSLIVISIIIVVIVGFARDRVNKARQAVRQQQFIQDQGEITGRIGVSVKNADASYKAGDTVTVFVYADSQEQDITGYDAVLQYNPEQVQFESVKSVLDGMDIYETVDASNPDVSELIITGIQSTATSEPFVLNNTALAEVTFTLLSSGEATIDVAYEPGSKRESNLITTKNQDILSTVIGTTLSVK